MSLATQTPLSQATGAASIVAVRPDDKEIVRDLPPGGSVLVGSERNCGLQLPCEGVAGIHCQISFNDGEVWVQDWYSETGTFINGKQITTGTQLPPDGEIRVGGCRILVKFGGVSSGAQRPSGAGAETSRVVDAAGTARPGEEPPPAARSNDSASVRIADLEAELDRARAEIDRLYDELDRAASGAPSDGYGDGYQLDSVETETLELLRAEVEHLQGELADRDARLAELSALSDSRDAGSAAPSDQDSPEMAALADRLEQLLDELERSDERIGTMQEMLRLSEEASLAEKEERRQVESWLGDIERRIGEREAEWQAENQVLLRRLEEVSAERDRIKQRRHQSAPAASAAAPAPGAAPPQDGLIEELRTENASLERRLKETEERCSDLQAQLEGRHETVQQYEQHDGEVPEAVRTEQLQLAQERAALARQRAELTQLRDELERERQKMEKSGSADGKIHAFREHLKEIHQQEERERQQSLAGRISRLWKRLDGR